MLQIDKALGAKIFSSFGRFEPQKRLLERSFGATEMPNEGELLRVQSLKMRRDSSAYIKAGRPLATDISATRGRVTEAASLTCHKGSPGLI